MKEKFIAIILALVLVCSSVFVLKNYMKEPSSLSYSAYGMLHDIASLVEKWRTENEMEELGEQTVQGVLSGLDNLSGDDFTKVFTVCADVIEETVAVIAIGVD